MIKKQPSLINQLTIRIIEDVQPLHDEVLTVLIDTHVLQPEFSAFSQLHSKNISNKHQKNVNKKKKKRKIVPTIRKLNHNQRLV